MSRSENYTQLFCHVRINRISLGKHQRYLDAEEEQAASSLQHQHSSDTAQTLSLVVLNCLARKTLVCLSSAAASIRDMFAPAGRVWACIGDNQQAEEMQAGS